MTQWSKKSTFLDTLRQFSRPSNIFPKHTNTACHLGIHIDDESTTSTQNKKENGEKAPHMIAETGHDELSHKLRLVYYKDKDWNDEGPSKMKVVAEHGKTPAVLTSAFRTDRATRDGKLIYMDKSYYEGKMK